MKEHEKIEQSIIKRFRKEIFKPFVRALNEYNMISPDDKIAVCISGGKDSMLLAKCMQEILRHGKMKFELVFLTMNPGYTKTNLEKIENNSKRLGLPIIFFDAPIFDIVKSTKDSPCYLCARMRRGYLYSKAKELGCNKIALGHHFDDVIETILMSMLYGAEMKTMMPKVLAQNFEGMELIRPLYFVKEKDILKWANYNDLDFLKCACFFTENVSCDSEQSKRQEMKKLIEELRKKNENVDINIMKSAHNVNLETIIGYKKDGKEYSFLDIYNKKKDKKLKTNNPKNNKEFKNKS